MSRRHRGGLAAMALACVVALTGCITVPTGEPLPATTAAGPQTLVDRLKAAPVNTPTEGAGQQELRQFVSDTRNIACVFTDSRAGHLNQPWEPNNFTDQANDTAPIIPVVNCQLASYPVPAAKDITDNCSGTNIGYLGGTVLLSPDTVAYGSCRAGVTAVEAAFGANGTATPPMAQIPVLEQGTAMEGNGYRCAPLDDGVACANLATGLGFFVSAKTYELFGPGQGAPSEGGTTPAATTPATAPAG